MARLHTGVGKEMKAVLLKISDLIVDSELYPRIKSGWLTAYQYAQAMKANSVFPPITVGIYKDKKYVVDGSGKSSWDLFPC